MHLDSGGGTRPQRDGIEADLDVLRTIDRDHAGFLRVGLLEVQPGAVHEADEVVDLGPSPQA